MSFAFELYSPPAAGARTPPPTRAPTGAAPRHLSHKASLLKLKGGFFKFQTKQVPSGKTLRTHAHAVLPHTQVVAVAVVQKLRLVEKLRYQLLHVLATATTPRPLYSELLVSNQPIRVRQWGDREWPLNEAQRSQAPGVRLTCARR